MLRLKSFSWRLKIPFQPLYYRVRHICRTCPIYIWRLWSLRWYLKMPFIKVASFILYQLETRFKRSPLKSFSWRLKTPFQPLYYMVRHICRMCFVYMLRLKSFSWRLKTPFQPLYYMVRHICRMCFVYMLRLKSFSWRLKIPFQPLYYMVRHICRMCPIYIWRLWSLRWYLKMPFIKVASFILYQLETRFKRSPHR